MPLPLLAAAGIGVGTGLLGGVLNLFSAGKQAKAAEAAAKAQREAATRAGQGVMDAAAAGNRDIISGADRASAAASTAAGEAAKGVYDRTDAANNKLEEAKSYLDPYRTTGETGTTVINNGLQAGGQFNKNPTMADLQIDPGFQFRLSQGLSQQNRIAAANGYGGSGTAAMALERFRQGTSSEEYAKAFQRFRDNRADVFGFADKAANRGLDASKTGADILGREGDNLIGAGKYGGDKLFQAGVYGGDKVFDASRITADNSNTAAARNGEFITQDGNAQAAGIVGKANADASKFTGFFNGAQAGASVFNLLSNPKVTSAVTDVAKGIKGAYA